MEGIVEDAMDGSIVIPKESMVSSTNEKIDACHGEVPIMRNHLQIQDQYYGVMIDSARSPNRNAE